MRSEAFAGPGAGKVGTSQLADFTRFCEDETGRRFESAQDFSAFSVAEYRRFWRLYLERSGLIWEGDPEIVCSDDRCERATFFPGLRLNYAENLLRGAPEFDDRVVLVSRRGDGTRRRLSRRRLREHVLALAAHLRRVGIEPGDRVAAIATNNAELVIGALATAAIGATFSSAAPDMGAAAILSRFEQLSPKLLMANLGAGAGDRVAEVVGSLTSVEAVISLDDGVGPAGLAVPVLALAELLASGEGIGSAEGWKRFPFNHPLFILFTSGTTGPPKCIVHGAGGTLLEHLKEQRLHLDLRNDDTLFFHTTAAWMMWNWQLSALACAGKIVLFDGTVDGPGALWNVVAEEKVTVFGTSPPYLQLCEDRGYSPRRDAPAPGLRSVLSTGSVLNEWQYDWLEREVGEVRIQSISGGTDIIGCFVLGHPELPVRRGMLQSRSLGLDVRSLPAEGGPPGSTAGELVCANPFPSRPLGFLGDDGSRFHDSYFSQNEGFWTHGDLIEFEPDGQARILGRSDGVLNIQGVRIGPSEIYQALHRVPEVVEAMAVEQQRANGGARLVLLVVLRDGAVLDGPLTLRVRRAIAGHATALHVPELMVAVEELPVTHSGKRSERAGRDAVNARAAANAQALANPGSVERIGLLVRAAEEAAASREVEPVPSDASSAEKLRAIWTAVLGIEEIADDDNFFDIGGTSLLAIRIFLLIEERLGVQLPLSTLFDAPTIGGLAAVVDDPSRFSETAILIRPGTGGPPVFFAHTVWGDVLEMRHVALAMKVDVPVYGLRARGAYPGEEQRKSVEEMAADCVAGIRGVQPSGPYCLAGYSFGGLVAFETARLLAEQGEEIAWLGLIDAELHDGGLPWALRWRRRVAARIKRAIDDPGGVAGAPLRRALRILDRTGLRVFRREAAGSSTDAWGVQPWLEEATPGRRATATRCIEAAYAFRPRPYPGAMSFFRPTVVVSRLPGFTEPLPIWRRVARGGVSLERVPGVHDEMVSEIHAGIVASLIDSHLAKHDGASAEPRADVAQAMTVSAPGSTLSSSSVRSPM